MTRRTTTLLVGGSCAAWAGWLALVVNASPADAGPRYLFFGLTLVAIALTGTLAAWVLEVRRAIPEPPSLGESAFHGGSIAVVVTVSLWLQAERLLSPVHIVVLLGTYWVACLLLWSGRASR